MKSLEATILSAWHGHAPFASFIVSKTKPKLVVELGVHMGFSLFHICAELIKLENEFQIYGVDTWKGDAHTGFYDDDIYQSVKDLNEIKYFSKVRLLRMSFDESLRFFEDLTIDLLHIDGLHTYEAVKHDFEAWLPKLSPKAVVLFHDTAVLERNFGVHRLFAELLNHYPGFNFLHSHGLGVLLVGSQRNDTLLGIAQAYKENSEYWLLIKEYFEAAGRQVSDQYTMNLAADKLKQDYDLSLN